MKNDLYFFKKGVKIIFFKRVRLFLVFALAFTLSACAGMEIWRTAALIETGTGSAELPQITVDSTGNAIAVWHQDEGAVWNIWANRYTVGSGWGTAALIETGPGSAELPQVAVDSTGNAIAVWHQYDGTTLSIWANRYTVDSGGWGTAKLIETGTGSAELPQVAVDSTGNAIAVWRQYDGAAWSIWANRYTVGSGWGTAALIETGPGSAELPQIAVDSTGSAIAVWHQDDDAVWSIWANRYTVGSGWGTAKLIETGTGNAELPQIAVDSTGNAIAVWRQYDGAMLSIWANRYTVGSGWGTAELIETGAGSAELPQIAVDSTGNAIAVWHQDDGTVLSIWANRYKIGSGWGTAKLIETGTGSVRDSQVAVDSTGNAIAVWRQYDGTVLSIWTNRYKVGSGWGTAKLIETGTGSAELPQVAVSNGNTIAVWRQYDGAAWSIWANRRGTLHP